MIRGPISLVIVSAIMLGGFAVVAKGPQVLTRYLEGEMAHIMNSEGISPRIFKIDESKL